MKLPRNDNYVLSKLNYYMIERELKPLKCQSCGAPLSFGNDGTLRCEHCRVYYSLPEEKGFKGEAKGTIKMNLVTCMVYGTVNIYYWERNGHENVQRLSWGYLIFKNEQDQTETRPGFVLTWKDDLSERHTFPLSAIENSSYKDIFQELLEKGVICFLAEQGFFEDEGESCKPFSRSAWVIENFP